MFSVVDKSQDFKILASLELLVQLDHWPQITESRVLALDVVACLLRVDVVLRIVDDRRLQAFADRLNDQRISLACELVHEDLLHLGREYQGVVEFLLYQLEQVATTKEDVVDRNVGLNSLHLIFINSRFQ